MSGQMKVCFETFGCRLNRAEALEEEAKYLAAGWTLTDSHSDADRIVIRGCSVTARAQRECEKLIAHLRRKYPNKRLFIQGCFKDDKAANPLSVVARVAKTASDNLLPAPKAGLAAVTPLPTRTARAYLKVQDGCSCACTFCIVPKFRGAPVSVDFNDVIAKACRFIDSGYREIVVTGCNLALYASQGKRLPDLLAALADTAKDGNCRIRLGSVEPGACATEVIRAMSEHANLCRFLHLTVQSGSDRILKAMRRPYSTKDVIENVLEAKRLMPTIGLGCDLMTGFPGESDIDFLSTKSLVQRLPFANAHVFPFSERPGTPAAAMSASIPREIRKARAHELAEIFRGKARLFAQQFIGKPVDVIIEDEKHQAGWTSEYVWFQPKTTRATDLQPRKALVTAIPRIYEHGWLR